MGKHGGTTNQPYSIDGYDFARTILNRPGTNGVEVLLSAAHGGETDWLEKKAAVYLSAEHDQTFRTKLEKCPPENVAEEKKFYEAELLRTIACALVALHNSRGGVLFIGIDDANNPVPFESCDNDGILMREGLEAYVRKSILGRLLPKDGLFQCKKACWKIAVGQIGIESKVCSYNGTSIVALLVPSLKPGKPPVLVTRIENNRPRKLLLQREPGDIGEVRSIENETMWNDSAATLADFHDARERAFLSNTDLFGTLKGLGIEPPPMARRIQASSNRRLALLWRGILAMVAAWVLFGGMAWLFGKPRGNAIDKATDERDSFKAYREAVQSGEIAVYSREEIKEKLNQAQTKHMDTVMRIRRNQQLHDAESSLHRKVDAACSDVGSIYGVCLRKSKLGRDIGKFREELTKFKNAFNDAGKDRKNRLDTITTDEEFKTLLNEIDEQKTVFFQLLDNIPEIAPEDIHNIPPWNARYAEQWRGNLLKLRDSLANPSSAE